MPDEWIIKNPKHAADRVLSLQTGPRFDSTRERAASFARNFFDSVDYDNLYKSIWEN
jgi:hypothetical protein